MAKTRNLKIILLIIFLARCTGEAVNSELLESSEITKTSSRTATESLENSSSAEEIILKLPDDSSENNSDSSKEKNEVSLNTTTPTDQSSENNTDSSKETSNTHEGSTMTPTDQSLENSTAKETSNTDEGSTSTTADKISDGSSEDTSEDTSSAREDSSSSSEETSATSEEMSSESETSAETSPFETTPTTNSDHYENNSTETVPLTTNADLSPDLTSPVTNTKDDEKNSTDTDSEEPVTLPQGTTDSDNTTGVDGNVTLLTEVPLPIPQEGHDWSQNKMATGTVIGIIMGILTALGICLIIAYQVVLQRRKAAPQDTEILISDFVGN